VAVFPIGIDRPVEHGGPLPLACDVVVIGGGVVGVATALFLRRKGLAVALVEKGRIAGEQSSRNWGWIRAQGRDQDEVPIALEAQRLWQALAPELDTDIGLTRGGVTYITDSAKAMARFEAWAAKAGAHGLATELIGADAVAARYPGMARACLGAMVTPSDMRAEPWVAVPALARLAAREGVAIVENCAARRLDVTAGRVAGVVTEQARVRANAVVLAGGAWSSLFLKAHGVWVPQLSVRSTVAATEQLPMVYAGGTGDDSIGFRPRRDGGYTLGSGMHDLYVGPSALRAATKYLAALRADAFSTRYHPAAPAGHPDAWGTKRQWGGDEQTPFERMRVLNPPPDPAALQHLARHFGRLFPGFGPIRFRAAWAGMIDAMPDIVPVLDHCAALPGLVIGTGLSGHGFGIGPGVGRVLADLATGGAAGHDLTRFRLSRFSDGSPMRPGPAL
jgi:glycine/D-amino acid oxidase-like deaminating enzyme